MRFVIALLLVIVVVGFCVTYPRGQAQVAAPRRRRGRVMTAGKIAAARELSEKGATITEISEEIGVSRTTVHRYVSGEYADRPAA